MGPSGPLEVRRVDFGSFTRPPQETGTGQSRRERLYGYLVRHGDGTVLFDTGMADADPETEAWYRPERIALGEALRAAGTTADEVTVVVNCHLHLDHCGGNRAFAGRPIVCQRRELSDARRIADYTLPELIDHAGATYLELDGEAEVRPGVRVLPTPGHTPGHQSLVVRLADGAVVLAGQSHPTAADFAAEAAGLAAAPADRPPNPWMTTILSLDPRRVLFAHDGTVWEP